MQLGHLYPDPGEGLWLAPVPDRLPDTHLLQVLNDASSDPDAITLITTIAACTTSDRQAAHLTAALGRSLATPAATTRYPRGLRRTEKAAQALLVHHPGLFLAPLVLQEHRTLDQAVLDTIPSLPLTAPLTPAPL